MKRKLKWLAIVLAVSLLGFGTALYLWPRDRITAESWQKIRIGMTEKEVEVILGGPGASLAEHLTRWQAAEKRIGKKLWEHFDDNELVEPKDFWKRFDEENGKYWLGRRGIVAIQFDEGRVRRKQFQGLIAAEPTFIDRLRDWLGW